MSGVVRKRRSAVVAMNSCVASFSPNSVTDIDASGSRSDGTRYTVSPRDCQGFATGDDDVQRPAAVEQRFDQLRARRDQMLAVVEHQQHARSCARHRATRRAPTAAALPHTERRRDCLCHELRD